MKIIRRILFFIALLLVAIAAFLYWGTYEEGVMAGKIIRISQKGLIFKTYEAKLGLESFGALRGTSPIAETFDFSVEPSNHELVKELEQVALSGERVNIHYKKRYIRVPWRGSTKYFATRVERLQR
ncbi:MAG: hypothetical protein WBJ36_12030 [Tenuifilum sp.]|uniref:hypothetical protein n=1 Tax=Tenuifilum sp. TaxID=2760880 RepID=UPI001B65EF24|nr:hypothetical protein [Bacteroidales bacterium]HOK60673.1 hypothetical protein [Tenuifilum sp.]MBP9029107.1 hypothetical protein [Bacteroidales bacterium]HOK84906.1 hypothetical protein [Tenuifilum sp.]HON71379.1 hypothetical protein [Tenuifilum sp.]